MTDNQDTWPAGATWVFQGTVASDATGGTHIATLTVTPGAGSEMQLLGGIIQQGANAGAQVAFAQITDASGRMLQALFNPVQAATTGSGFIFPIPAVGSNSTAQVNPQAPLIPIISGGCQLILGVSTAVISLTQTFAVVCRIKGAMPTATLADTVGAPVLTTNTNKVF